MNDLSYERDGVEVFRGAIPAALVEDVRRLAYDVYAESDGRFDRYGSFPLADGRTPLNCHVLPRFSLAREVLPYLPAGRLHTGALAITHSKFSYKPVGADARWYPHQDAAYKPGPRRGFVFAIPLEACDVSNGTLEVVPGRRPLLPFHRTVSDQIEILGFSYANTDRRPLVMSPGDVAAFSLYNVHLSGPNTSHGLRAYLFVEMEPWADYLTDDVGGAPIVVDS